MARYADAADLDTYGALPASSSSLFTTGQKEAALDEASAVADSYLASAGPVPLTSWGADLRAAVARMAAWRLLQGLRGYDAAAAGNSFKAAHDESRAWLRDVARGVAKVSGGSGVAPSQTGGARVSTRSSRGWHDDESTDDEDAW